MREENTPATGKETVYIPHANEAIWTSDDLYGPVGIYQAGVVRVELYKSSDMRLHVYVTGHTWKDHYLKADIPFRASQEKHSTMDIRWTDKGGTLSLSGYDDIEVPWQLLQ